MKIVITGASGLIGSALVHRLTSAEHDVLQLVRREPANSSHARWDPDAGDLDAALLEGAHAVINLSGAGIGDRWWTEARKRLILESRTKTTSLISETMASMDNGPSVLINASAIGFYGDRGDEELTEDSGPAEGSDFLSDVVQEWERATAAAENSGARVVHLRTGIVLDTGGGLLGSVLGLPVGLLLAFKLGVGGKVGDGSQWWSWVAIPDEVRAIEHLLASQLSGPVNVTAPNPATNAEFTKVLGSVLSRPTVVPVPRLALKVLLGGDLADSLAFTSARVLPNRLLEDGFQFTFPDLRPALENALRR
jgi:uncharacterized protein (TIGR01777 family)